MQIIFLQAFPFIVIIAVVLLHGFFIKIRFFFYNTDQRRVFLSRKLAKLQCFIVIVEDLRLLDGFDIELLLLLANGHGVELVETAPLHHRIILFKGFLRLQFVLRVAHVAEVEHAVLSAGVEFGGLHQGLFLRSVLNDLVLQRYPVLVDQTLRLLDVLSVVLEQEGLLHVEEVVALVGVVGEVSGLLDGGLVGTIGGGQVGLRVLREIELLGIAHVALLVQDVLHGQGVVLVRIGVEGDPLV